MIRGFHLWLTSLLVVYLTAVNHAPLTADDEKPAVREDVTPNEPKKEENKTDEEKKDESKSEEPKKEEPKKEEPKPDESKKDQPKKSGPKYRAGDMRRPRPTTVVPPVASTEEKIGLPPSDAIVLFDGRDFSQWQADRKPKEGESDEPKWKIEDGYFEIEPGSGGIHTRRKFGSCQIHFEWRSPAEVKGNGQGRGNSGFFINGHPEVQILDSFNNDTYPDGQAAGIYGHYPPLVNASRGPGEWQTYDIIYMAPQLSEKKKVEKPATYTVLHNGVLVHHATEVPGNQVECTFSLQDHGNRVRFRNFWVRPLRGYDEHPPGPELGK